MDAAGVDRFHAFVSQTFGWNFDQNRIAYLGEVLQRRLAANGGGADEYLARLELNPPRSELRAIAQELTVGETYFFRNRDQFSALSGAVLPERFRIQPPNRPLRILSAGCASGEEAYSIAILLSSPDANLENREVVIHGFDINAAAVERARAGRYSTWSLREASEEIRQRWFRGSGKEFVLDDTIRRMVTFTEANLADGSWLQTHPDQYDVIFCRNVLMYFAPEQARAAIDRLTRQLAQGGYLFLGHAETLRGLSQDYDLRHTHDTFYYRRKNALVDVAPGGANGSPSNSPKTSATPVHVDTQLDDAWVHTIQRASERIHKLTGARRPAAGAKNGATPATVPQRPSWDLASAMDLFREERFAEALTKVRSLPAGSEADPDVLLLMTILHIHNGGLDEAENVCATLLRLDGMNAGAHYLMALCCEHRGDIRGAINHDQMAAYLDATFAMPRLHLGLIARKQGDAAAAHREFAQALVLLRGEDVSRLLFFGGGFNRDALISVCTSGLDASRKES